MNTKLAIMINDEKVPAMDFVQQIIGRANLGYIASLKDVSLKPGDYVAIDIKIPGGTIDDVTRPCPNMFMYFQSIICPRKESARPRILILGRLEKPSFQCYNAKLIPIIMSILI